jgi:hypothetical protein
MSAPDPNTASPLPGHIEYVTWVHGDCLLLSGWFPRSPGQPLVGRLRGQTVLPVDMHAFAHPRLDSPTSDENGGKLLVVYPVTPDSSGWLDIEVGPLVLSISLERIGQLAATPADWARAVALPWDAEIRKQAADFIARASRPATGSTAAWSEATRRIHQALRLPARRWDNSPAAPLAAYVDALVEAKPGQYFIAGWARGLEGRAAVLTAEGLRIELHDTFTRCPLPEVARHFGEPTAGNHGWMALFTAPDRLDAGSVFEMASAGGERIEALCPEPVCDPVRARQRLLESAQRIESPSSLLVERCLYPALRELQVRNPARISSVDSFGEPPCDPAATIVVALDERIERLEEQLAQFADDPEIAVSDLLYLLDSPEQAARLRRQCPHLFAIYRVPFRLAAIDGGVGQAEANNAGARLARGRDLLFLHADVIPQAPGWLSSLQRFARSQSDMGALGPMLLDERGVDLHANRNSSCDAGASRARRVPVVAGACLLIGREIFEQVGGFFGAFVGGDFAGAELCLRLLEAGRHNWVLPEVTLFHLAGRFRPRERLLSAYDSWLSDRDLAARMREAMRRFAATADGEREA